MSSFIKLSISVLVGLFLGGCVASPRFTSEKFNKSSEFNGEFVTEGVASYYADDYHGRKTSNGEEYDMNAMTAAHQTLPFNTKVRVTNLQNGTSVIVRINDRGPFKDNRIIDVSYAAAKELGMIGPGTAKVKLQIIE
ncbi:MAG: septal ring lytic transglycosylase RlpA family protein [Ignavibacteriales bacterium]|nr:septal ring lytic transglycosylase RlpA family protein [Ignavibacteriales bacterium]